MRGIVKRRAWCWRPINILCRDPAAVTVADITRLCAFDKSDFATMRRANSVKLLPESWKEYFRQRLSQPSTR